jgi:hypothetical protein
MAVLLIAAGCGSNPTASLTGPRGPITLAAVSGTNQCGIQGERFARQLRLEARDRDGEPVAGIPVTIDLDGVLVNGATGPLTMNTSSAGEVALSVEADTLGLDVYEDDGSITATTPDGATVVVPFHFTQRAFAASVGGSTITTATFAIVVPLHVKLLASCGEPLSYANLYFASDRTGIFNPEGVARSDGAGDLEFDLSLAAGVATVHVVALDPTGVVDNPVTFTIRRSLYYP